MCLPQGRAAWGRSGRVLLIEDNHADVCLTRSALEDDKAVEIDPHKHGFGSPEAAVLGIVQRGGDVRYKTMKGHVTARDVRLAIDEHVDAGARLMTDESRAYLAIGRAFGGGHETVMHSAQEYVRGDVHSNTIEGAFSLIKRGIYGTFHSVSKKHLPRYVAEFEFRYNTRKLDDGERIDQAIKAADGKRLTYAEQVSSAG